MRELTLAKINFESYAEFTKIIKFLPNYKEKASRMVLESPEQPYFKVTPLHKKLILHYEEKQGRKGFAPEEPGDLKQIHLLKDLLTPYESNMSMVVWRK